MPDASVLEQLWSAASAIALVLHLWLSLQAYLDWRVALDAAGRGEIRRWRALSAGWYLVGQVCLFLPKIAELMIGVVAMTTPPPISPEVEAAAVFAQYLLIVSEWIGAAGAVAFWFARRALAGWADERDVAANARDERADARQVQADKRDDLARDADVGRVGES